MGAIIGSIDAKERRRLMKDLTHGLPDRIRESSARRQPVEARLKDITASSAKICPPPGDDRLWVYRLKRALGTLSLDFVNTSLVQLQSATTLPNHGICEASLNSALALIEAVKPKDEVEGALAVQMASCHAAAMAVLVRLAGAHGSERRIGTLGTVAARLMKTYALQVETLRRLRNGGSQIVRVEHIHIHQGGQAIVGAVQMVAD